jgi:HEAT repeat protein/thiol-disulfide isomerase/thioredoxin
MCNFIYFVRQEPESDSKAGNDIPMHARNQKWRNGIASAIKGQIGVQAALIAMLLLLGDSNAPAARVRPQAVTSTNATARLATRMKPLWMDDLDAGLTMATVEYRPVLVFFSSPDCPWCLRLKSQVLQDPALADLLNEFVRVEIDTSVDRETGAQYGIRGVPALLILMNDGRVRTGHAGYVDANGLRKLLEPVLNPELVRAANAPDQEILKILEGAEIRTENWPALLTAFGRDPLRDAIRARLLKIDPFPAATLVDLLTYPRLAVRAGALDLLEELAGTTHGLDVWKMETFSTGEQPAALKSWSDWAAGVTGRVDTVYASLDGGSIARLVQDLVSEDRERSRRAMRLLGQGGDAVASALSELLDMTPELPDSARQRIRVVQYALYLPSHGLLSPDETAHRLVFGNPDARMKALGSLAALGAKALPVLREFLGDPDPMIRETAVDTIIAAGKRRALPDLGRLLMTESNRHVQHAVLRGLGGIKSQAALVLLVPFLSHADENLAVAAFESVTRMESREPADAVATGLKDPRWRVRVAALEAAGKLRLKTLGKPILDLLKNDSDNYVRFAAVNALAALEAKDSASTLKDIFLEDNSLKGAIIAAFGAMELPLPAEFQKSLPNLPDETLFAVVQGLKEAGVSGLPMASGLCDHSNEDIACTALSIVGSHVGKYGQYMPQVVKALQSGSRAKRMAVLESVTSRSRYYSDDEAIDVGFEDEAVETNAGHEQAAPMQMNASVPPSAVDDVFAAFTDPGAEQAAQTAADATVDDLFAAFAAATAGPDATAATNNAGEGAVNDVFAAFDAAAPDAPATETVTTSPGSGSLIGKLFGAFGVGTQEASLVTPQTAAWKTFNAAAGDCLQAAEADVRLAAALWLASQGDERSIPELTVSTMERTSAQRADIAQALGRIRHREGFSTLLRLVDDPASSVREAAMTVLYNSPIGITRMFTLINQPNTRLTIEELIANRKRNPQNNPEFSRRLREHATNLMAQAESPVMRNAGLLLLGEYGSRADAPLLSPFLGADDPFERRAAWYALGKLDLSRFEKELDRVVADPSEWVRGVVPALYAKSNAAWVHFLNADTPLSGNRYDHYYGYEYDNYGARRTSMAVPVRDALRKLSVDPALSVRFESLFCLMVNRQHVDLQALVDAANAFPDRKAVAGRMASFMMSNAETLGKPFAVLLPYLESSDYSDSSMERLRKRFDQEDKSEALGGLKTLNRPENRSATTNEPLFVEADVEAPRANALHAVYFTTAGCRECERARAILDQLTAAIPELTVEVHEIKQPDALRLNQVLSSRFRVPPSAQGVTPALFAGGGYIIKDGFSTDRVGSLIAASSAVPLAEWREVTDTDMTEAAAAIENRFADVSILLLLAYAISDSINPCAFAAIIFFISYLQVTRRSPRQIAEVALAFITAVFVTYLVLGFGLGEIIARIGALRRAGAILNWLMAGLTLVLGLLSLRDAWLCAHGRMQAMTLQLPGMLKSRMHQIIRTQARQPRFVLAAALTGVVISILELACTGQAYLPAIHYMLRTGDRMWDAAGYLVLYNAAFVAPLFVIFGLTIGGMRSESFIRWLQRHAAGVKLVAAALFLLLCAILVHQHLLPDLRAWR